MKPSSKHHLTKRDLELLETLSHFGTRREIAQELGVTETSVRARIHRIARLFGVQGKTGQGTVRYSLVSRWRSPIFRIGLAELHLLPPYEEHCGHLEAVRGSQSIPVGA
jgi:DNA-binding CsgD family transcriptional regulator